MKMTIEDIKEYKKNAVKILKDHNQYATAKATAEAFDTLIWYKEIEESMQKVREYTV